MEKGIVGGSETMRLSKSRVDKIIEKLIGHEVTISHIVNSSGERLKTSGVVREIDDEIITVECYDIVGHKDLYHLNRKACQLYSILDEGLHK